MVDLVRVIINQPILLCVLRNLGGGQQFERQHARIVRAPIGEIDKVLPEILQLLAHPSIATLVVGNPENLLFEETVKRFRLFHWGRDSFQ